MKKYVIIMIIIALITLSMFSIWFFFIKKNPILENYEKEFNEKINAINNQTEDNQPNNNDNPVIDPNSGIKTIIDDTNLKPNDGQIIISSETKVLNEQGQELLDELSKQLEESFQTISTTTGVIDSEILNNESDINMGE